MSFRDNLQHLRATRNMTQEQLAMLLGVSRQTVTKWEAEKSNPEMDKLIDMCRIFDCTLDDLVRGDLTDRPREAVAMPSSGAPVDVCGYDEHMRGWAFSVATGVAVIILGVSAGVLFAMADLLPGAGDAPFFVAVLAAVLVGLAFLIPAGVRHSAFVKAHPYIEDFYTVEEKTHARESVTRAVVCGIGLIFAGAAAVLLSEGTAYEAHAAAAMLAFTAAGVWLFIYFGMMSAHQRGSAQQDHRRRARVRGYPERANRRRHQAASAAEEKSRRQARRGMRRHHDRGHHRGLGAAVRAGFELARPFELRTQGNLRHVVLDGVAGRRHALRHRGAAHERVRLPRRVEGGAGASREGFEKRPPRALRPYVGGRGLGERFRWGRPRFSWARRGRYLYE